MGKTVKLPISNFLLDEPHAHADKLWGPYPSLDAASAAIPTAMKVASFKFGVLSSGVFSEYIYLEDNGTPQELASLKVQLLLNPASGAVAGKILSLDNDLKPVWVEPSSTAERVSFDNSEEIFDGDVTTTQAAIEALKDLLDALSTALGSKVTIESIEQTVVATESEGNNEVSMTLSDDTVVKFYIKNGAKGEKGDQGDKGDTVVLDNGQAYTLYNVPGSNTDGAMTQKAVTDAIGDVTFDVSAKFPNGGVNGGNTYTLPGAIGMIPTNSRKGGMSIKFLQQIPATYNIIKTEGLSTQPSGIALESASAITTGIYEAASLVDFSELPATVNAQKTYYFAVTDGDVTTYTSWLIAKHTNESSEYVHYTYNGTSILDESFLQTNLWATSDTKELLKGVASFAEFVFNGYIATNHKAFVQATKRYTDFTEINGDLLYICLPYYSNVSVVSFYSGKNENTAISSFTVEGIPDGTLYSGQVPIPVGAKYYRATMFGGDRRKCYAYCTNRDNIAKLHYVADVCSNIVPNKFDKDIDIQFVNSGYLNVYGLIVVAGSFKTSNYIFCKGASMIRAFLYRATNFYSIAFYDESKVLIPNVSIKGDEAGYSEYEITIPPEAVYVRFCNKRNTDDAPKTEYAKLYFDMSVVNEALEQNYYSKLSQNDANLYKHFLNKPFDFSGKNVVAFGDSITYGVYSVVNENTVLNDKTHSYIKVLSDKLGFALDNRGVSSTTICNQIKSAILSYTGTADYIIIAGGTNDFNQSLEIGTFDTNDTTEFYGALRAICEHLQTNCPNATVIFITPIPYTDAYFNKVDTHGVPIRPYKYGNLIGKTLNDYRNAIYQVATAYGYSCINGGLLGMPEGAEGGWNNIMCSDMDGCHPTILGHQLLANCLVGLLS